MTFNWTIDVGNVIAACGLLVGFVVAHQQNIRKMQAIETKLELIYAWFKSRVITGGVE